MSEGVTQGRSRLAAVAAYAAIPLLCLALAAWQQRVGRWYRAESFIALAVAAPTITTLIRHPRTRWLLPGLAPLLAATALGLNWMHPQAAIAATAGLLALTLLAAGIDVAHHLDRATTAIGHALATIAGTLIFVLTILPAWLWTRLRRHHPLTTTPGWHPTTTDDLDPTALGTTPTRTRSRTTPTRRTWTGRLTWSIGCLTLLLATNYGAGWTWDRAFPTSAPTTIPKDDDGRPRDPRNDSPAMAAYPWRERYFEDIQHTTGGYWPFTEYRPNDFTSPYVNQRGWVRDSYEPAGDLDDMPIVWMFGGSTTWGEGQRDDYTIASWISRFAERDGVPIHMQNYGERGWTHFQEMILFEQQLELAPKPAMAIFYDGANEVTAQSLITEAVPTHTLAYTYAQRLAGGTIATSFVQRSDADAWRDVWHAYSRHSAAHKIVGWIKGTPVEASPAQTTDDEPPGAGFEGGQTQRDNGGVYEYHTTDQDGIDAGKVYERGQALTRSIAKRHDVQPFFFWQPMGYVEGPYRKAREQLTAPTIDISEVLLDHDSGPNNVFIDGGHTNEEGARLVAVAIWDHLRPSVERWYADR